MQQDLVADTFSTISNAEESGKMRCNVDSSNLVKSVLDVMEENGMIASYERDETKKNEYIVNLKGVVNNCGAIKPRFSVQVDEYEKYEKRYLPAKGMGLIIVTTPEGVLSHEEAKERNVGGQLIGYVY